MSEEDVSVDYVDAPSNVFVDVSKYKQWDIKNIPQNFFMLISAKRRSGKTYLVKEICYHIKDRFKEVFLFSETEKLQLDNPYDFIASDYKYDHFDEEVLNGILERQNQIKENNKMLVEKLRVSHPVLIILDDVITGPAIRKSPALKSLATQGRHSDVSVICLSQTISARFGFPSVIRDNVDIFICFTLHTCFNRETASECFASLISKKDGLALINSITQEKPFQAAIFDLSKQNIKTYYDYVFKFIAPEKQKKFKMGSGALRNGTKSTNKAAKFSVDIEDGILTGGFRLELR